MEKPTKQEDILISICFPEFLTNKHNDKALLDVTTQINELYRYWEVVIVVDASHTQKYEHLIELISNIRLIAVRHKLQYHRRRTVAASEAIGDIVVLASIREAPYLDIPTMIGIAHKTGSIVVGEQTKKSIFNPVIRTLGIASGFNVSTNDLSTTAYPRTLINQLLSHYNRHLALRFTPRDNRIPVIKHSSTSDIDHPNSRFDWARRLSFIQKLFINSAPNILSFVTLSSVLVCVVAPVYGIYAVVTWLTLDTVQPGWLTTSLALSLTTTFLGVALLGVSMGVQSILEKLSPDVMDDVAGEISTIDLFSQVRSNLNVEVPEPQSKVRPSKHDHS